MKGPEMLSGSGLYTNIFVNIKIRRCDMFCTTIDVLSLYDLLCNSKVVTRS